MFTLKWIPKPHMEIVLANEVLDLCDLLVELSHPCPLHPGKYVFFYKQSILSVIPKVTTQILFSTPALILPSNCRGCMKFMY